MPTGTLAFVMSIGGMAIKNNPITKTADGTVTREVSIPPGKSGSLTTRTGDGAGVITLAAGHGIAALAVVDIYWTGGARYGVTIDSLGGVGDIELTFDDTPTASGDALPGKDTAVVVSPRVTVNVPIDGDAVEMFGVHSTQRGQVTFFSAAEAAIAQFTFAAAENVESWYSGSAAANPLTGDPITYAEASNASPTVAAMLTILSLEDSTP